MIDTQGALLQLKQAESMKLLKQVRVMTWDHPTQYKQVWYIQFEPGITGRQRARLAYYFKHRGIKTLPLGDDILRAYIPK